MQRAKPTLVTMNRPGAPCEAGSLLAEASLWLLIQEARARGDERHAVKRAGKDPRAAIKQPSDAGVVAYVWGSIPAARTEESLSLGRERRRRELDHYSANTRGHKLRNRLIT